jgi:hypothetical protein
MTDQRQEQQEKITKKSEDASSSSSRSSSSDLPKSIWKHSRSHRVLIGSVKEPGTARNLMIAQTVFSGVTIIVLVIVAMRSIGQHREETEKDAIIAKLKEELQLQASGSSSVDRRNIPLNCNLYMAPSTLPTTNTGISLFATRDFSTGQIILDNSDFPTTTLITSEDTSSSSQLQRMFCQYSGIACVAPSKFEGEMSDVSDHTITILQHLAALIKPHPYLKNVQLTPKTMQLIAIRSISPGEELFSGENEMIEAQLQYPSHVAPTLYHYQLANKIYHGLHATLSTIGRNIVRNINQASTQATRNAYIPNPKFVMKKAQQEYKDAQITLQTIVHEAVSNIDNVTASLLPTTEAFHLPSAYASEYHAMKNHSIQWLDKNSFCYDETIVPKLKKDNGEVVAVARRFIAKSEVFTIAPVLMIYLPRTLTDLNNELIQKHCLTHHHSNVILCLSSYATYMIRHPSFCTVEHTETSDRNIEQPIPSSCSDVISNAEVTWSTGNQVNDKYLTWNPKSIIDPMVIFPIVICYVSLLLFFMNRRHSLDTQKPFFFFFNNKNRPSQLFLLECHLT